MAAIDVIPLPPSLLGESPFWHPQEEALYWCDIDGKQLNRWHPASAQHRCWDVDAEPGCAAPMQGGGLMVAMRDGLFSFDPASGARRRLADPPYDPAIERFNDGKADPHGRFLAGTIYEPRDAARAALYRWRGGLLERIAGDATVANGLAWSVDGRTMYWSDTTAHTVYAFDVDADGTALANRRVFARFPAKRAGEDLSSYGGRPDGAAVDQAGNYWCAMFEGQRLLQLAPDGALLQSIALPVRCPTMPCFGGADLRTLYVTTARQNRPAEELAAQPLAGCVLRLRVDVPGLPVNIALA